MTAAYDYIVTGAGSAGCVLAARLSEDPDVRVLALEAGGTDRHYLFHWPAGFARMTKGVASWGWSTVPQRHLGGRQLWYTQARVLGGGSSINAQLYTRGNPADYDTWRDEHGCAGWGYADVLPYYRRAEGNERWADAYHGTAGPLGVSVPRATLPVCDAFLRAAQEWGIPYNADFNGATQAGIGPYQLTIRGRRRSSAASAYLAPARARPNLTVLTKAMARRVLVSGGRASGVEALVDGRSRTFTATREVLVTSGAIGSPRLLLLSGIGPAEHLREVGVPVVHDLAGVGGNLHDHVNLCVLCECTGDHSYDNVVRPHRLALAGLQYLLFGTGPVMSPLFETGGFWHTQADGAVPDIQFHLGQGSGIEQGIAKLSAPGVTLNTAFLQPRSRGTVRLTSANANAAPLIDPNYWAEPADRAASLRGLEIAREIMAGPALRDFVKREVLPGPEARGDDALDAYAHKMAKTDHHPVGTCRMGSGDDAVVTPDLRVRGIDGLRVCDSSVMPRVVSSNTNAATIMVAEKAADLVAGREPLPAALLQATT